jgi:hypothetical protein
MKPRGLWLRAPRAPGFEKKFARVTVRSGTILENAGYPRLTYLVDGDLKMTVDFPGVYATALEDRLGLPSTTAVNGTFEHMQLLLPARSS